MSLLAAILSQTNKTLGILLNFTGTFPTSTINTINTNTQPAAQASATQTGMSNQGYSPTVAGRIDTTISSRATQFAQRSKSVFQVSAQPSNTYTAFSLGGTGRIIGLRAQCQAGTGTFTVNII